MPYIEVIQPESATDELQSIYNDLIKSRGKIAEVHKIQSLNPKTIMAHMNLYMSVMFGKSPLKRVHREMMAVIVSQANQCEYCITHHLEAVKNFWKDEEKVNALRSTETPKDKLTKVESALCEFAWDLTHCPHRSKDGKLIEPLKKLGLSDREILDATLVIAYFNFVNRIVLGLGVELEENPGGYNYE